VEDIMPTEHPSEEEIMAYFEGELKGKRFQEVDEHVQVCEACQDVLASGQQLPPEHSEDTI
jgi:anti-sigma factor RsiW